MIAWIKSFFASKSVTSASSQLYGEVLDRAQETKGLIDATLEAVSEEQISFQEEINALVHEVTLKKIAIADGAAKAVHVQKIRDLLAAGIGEVKEAMDDVADAVEEIADAVRN